MALREVLITDEQWAKIAPHIPKQPPQPKGGRPWQSDRACFEAIIWMARSGARWKDLPPHFPSPSTVWRRLRDWQEADVFKDMWRAFLEELDEKGPRCGKNQAGQGIKVHGGGRWSGSTSRNSHRICVTGRDQTTGPNA